MEKCRDAMTDSNEIEVTRRECIRRLGGVVAAGFALPLVGGPAFGAEAEPSVKAKAPDPKTGIVYDPVYKQHVTGAGHPESPDRCDAVMKALEKAGLDKQTVRIEIRRATDDEILLCHTKEYLATVKKDVGSGAAELSTGDTAICGKTLDVALAAAGGVLCAVDAVVGGKAKNAFCVIRPPGHHAMRSKGMGFCVFNNVAIAARYAQTKHKLGKVLICDWDVHHGNGTQDIFYEDGTVLYASTHLSPWYPFSGDADETGRGKGKGCILNVPLAAGSGGKEVIGAFKEKILPAAAKFKPEMVLVSAGFDSRKDERLGRFTLTDDDFAELTRLVIGVAKEHSGGRLVSVLEGGYDLEGLGLAAAAHVGALVKQ